jgi:hypothetical protein
MNLDALLALRSRHQQDGSHDDLVTSRIIEDTRPRCNCGNLLTITDTSRCRECRITAMNKAFQRGDR